MFRRFYEKVYPKSRMPDLSNEVTQSEAKAAVESADDAYIVALDNDPQISRVVTALKSQRERNHFAELLEITMRGTG